MTKPNQVFANRKTTRFLSGASTMAIIAAWAAPAMAQEGPGTIICPVDGDVVTCSGIVVEGFDSRGPRGTSRTTARRFIFRDAIIIPNILPPRAPIVIYQTENITIDIGAGTRIVDSPPGGFQSAAIGVSSSYSVNRDPSVRNTVLLNHAADTQVFDANGQGAIRIFFGGAITVNNTGKISVLRGFGSQNRDNDGILVNEVDSARVVNSGTIFLGPSSGTGTYNSASDYAIRIFRAEIASVTNTSTGVLTGQVNIYNAISQTILNDGEIIGSVVSSIDLNYDKTDVNFTNNGVIRGGVRLAGAGNQVVKFINNGLISSSAGSVYNSGLGTGSTNLEFRNRGTISGGINFSGGGDQSVIMDNTGILGGGMIYRFIAKSVQNTHKDTIALSNTSNIAVFTGTSSSQGVVGLGVLGSRFFDDNFGFTQITLTNSGNFANSGIMIDLTVAGGSFIAGFDGRITNSGNVKFIGVDVATYGAPNKGTIVVENTGSIVDKINVGANRLVSLTSSGSARGIITRQGFGTNLPYSFASNFDGSTTIRNSGDLTSTVGRASPAIFALATADIDIINSGKITVSGTTQDAAVDYVAFPANGIEIESASDLTLANSGAINVTAGEGVARFPGQAGAGIALREFSLDLDAALVTRALNDDFLDATYNQNKDFRSQYAISTTADITANGGNMFGIAGALGISKRIFHKEEIGNTGIFDEDRYLSAEGNGDKALQRFDNDLASLSLTIGARATVTGGTQRGSGVHMTGLGKVTLNNAGSIIGLGEIGTGAVNIGGLEFLNDFTSVTTPITAGKYMNLVDSLNTGTIRSGKGYGIWTETGSITNLINRGLISGGQDLTQGDKIAIRAARDSSIINDTGGTITGDIMLESAGSDTLLNRGMINGRVTLGGGDDTFTLGTGGNLPNVDGGTGTDRFAVNANMGTLRIVDIGAIPLTNFELFAKRGLGFATLTGTTTNPLFNVLNVEAGTLLVNTALSGSTATVAANAALGGTGSLGAVALANGATLTPGGDNVGAITMASLALANESRLRFDLGARNVVGGSTNDLIIVNGALILDGILDVVARPEFSNGIYRLINYTGALTDNGLVTGVVPTGTYVVQIAAAGQVNLVVSGIIGSTPNIQFWDGATTTADGTIGSGAGTWNRTSTNWTRTDGAINDEWGTNFAVFQGTGGTVAIDTAGIAATGLQFANTGYRIEGGVLTLTAPSTLRVGDGTAAGIHTTATIASVIAGSGGIDKTDFGTLVLTGANTYTGGTLVSGGVLSVSADNALGTAAGSVTLNGGTLRTTAAMTSARNINVVSGGGMLDLGANAVTLSGTLGGSGALIINSSNILTLSGNSATRAGATRLATGTMALSGSLGGTLTVASGATLTGTGTTGNLIVEGTVSPGNSPGILTVNGNLTFATGSTYQVELAASGPSDRINVSGTATLTGGRVAITAFDPELTYTTGSSYRFINATGGVIGQFAGLTETSAFLDFALTYDATGANIGVTVVRMFPEVARTFNQRGAANGLRDLSQAVGSDAFEVYRTILFLDKEPARAAFDATSGEIYAVALASMGRESSLLADRLSSRGFGASTEGWGLWGGAFGSDQRVKTDGNGARFGGDATGGNIGIDYRGANNRWAVGVSGGKSRGNISLDSRRSDADTDGWNLGGYARLGAGKAGFSGLASFVYADAEADITRNMTFGTLSRTTIARAKLSSTTADLELRYGLMRGSWAFGPVASVEYGTAKIGSFSEVGANSLDLTSAGDSQKATRTSLGGFANYQSERGTVDFSVRYATGGEDYSQLGLSMAGSPTAFAVRSSAGSGDAALVRLTGEYNLGQGWSAGGGISAAFGDKERAIAGSATVAYRF